MVNSYADKLLFTLILLPTNWSVHNYTTHNIDTKITNKYHLINIKRWISTSKFYFMFCNKYSMYD